MDIKDIHEEVFKFLLEKREADPSLRYNLRFQNDERMKKGYWFHGEKDKLYVTFWDAWTEVFPSIVFLITQEGAAELWVDERRENGKLELWEAIAPALSLRKVNTKWTKSYPHNKTYLENLDIFIKKERPYINSLLELKERINDYPPFPEGKFSRNLNKVENFRKEFKLLESNGLSEEKFSKFEDLIKEKLTVTCLQLYNINAFETANISFDKQVTCFVGGNGSGKTTLLRGIALGLVGSKGFSGKELKLLAIKEARKNVRHYEKGIIDVFYTYKGQKLQNSVEFTSDEKEQKLVYLLEDKGQSLRDEKDSTFLQTPIIGFSQQTQSDIKTDTNKVDSPMLSDVEALILNKVDNRYNEFITWLEGLITAKADVDREYNKKIVDDVFEIINRVIDDKIELTSDTDAYVKTNRNPNGIPMNQLSQGYRNVLAWLGFFMKRMIGYQDSLAMDDIPHFTKLPAICLIDEIDTYLHPDWQYSILSGLVEYFPNVQFFVTSHSPLVLTSVPSEKISIFELDTDGVQIVIKEKTENLYGADANRAIESISSERKSDIFQKFEDLDVAIENNNLEEAQKILDGDELKKIDPHLDLGILRAKRLIRTKQLLKKAKEEAAK